MKKNRIRLVSLIAVSLMLLSLLGGGTSIAEESDPEQGPLVIMTIEAGVISWEPQFENGGAILTIAGPGGIYLQQEYESGARLTFKPEDGAGSALPDGNYRYELRLVPANVEVLTGYDKTLRDIAATKDAGEALVQSGSFSILSGGFITQGVPEIAEDGKSAKLLSPDVVHADDVIIDGSLCVGNDCYSGLAFGFDTVVLMENNLRILFDDTSTIQNYPRNDWRIVCNDSTDGGGNYFAIEDATEVSNIFVLEAGAPDNSLYVDSHGDVGINTSTPYYELHIVDGDTPTMRLEQDGSYGWTPQRWDVAGNETNFLIRDATCGYKLPFRIAPCAPSNSLTIKSDGNVGIGTWVPDAPLHVERAGTAYINIVGGTGDAQINLDGGGKSAAIWKDNAADVLNLRNAGSGDPHITIASSGDVGIGRLPTANELEVEGNASKTTAGDWLANSDIRIKTDIQDVRDALEVVDQLRPVKFRYTDEYRAKHPSIEDRYYYNFIAQEYQKVFPDSVQEGWDGYLQMDAYNVTPYLVAAVQELSKQNEELRWQNAELEARLTALEEAVGE